MDWIEAKIKAIVSDRRHGAAQLAGSAIRVLMYGCRRSAARDPESLVLDIKKIALRLASARPSMASIQNWCLVFAHRLQELASNEWPLGELRRQGVLLGEELCASQQRFVQEQVEAARSLVENCRSLVTLSYSSTLEAILRSSLPPGCRVTIAESRPLMEGRRLFTNLVGHVADLRMVTDSQLGLAIPAAELVLVGADSILRDLAVVNKTGTYLSALVAEAHQRDLYVAADTYKINFSADSSTAVLESKPGSEVWPRKGQYCENVYFDITPGRLVRGFVSEVGVLDAAAMQRYVRKWQHLAEELNSSSEVAQPSR
jgi:translation initiation factor 2B subunit (eIF-2B alpha/beta/delta family)